MVGAVTVFLIHNPNIDVQSSILILTNLKFQVLTTSSSYVDINSKNIASYQLEFSTNLLVCSNYLTHKSHMYLGIVHNIIILKFAFKPSGPSGRSKSRFL